MARPRNGTSAHTQYRRRREHLADLEARYEKLTRSRPGTPGKKAAKTRALNKLSRQLSAAHGLLTKARNAITKTSAERASAKIAAKQRRSEAAKKGWAKRRTARKPPSPAGSRRAQRFLEERDGEVKQILVDPPSRDDRSAIGSYWHAVGVFRNNGSTALLDRFEGRSIYDALTRSRLPFVTDTALLREAIAAGHTDFDDLYTEISWASAA